MKLFSRSISLILIVVILVSLISPNFVFAERKTDKKIVRVGWYKNEGMQNGDCDEELSGYNYEYLCKIAQYTNWEYEFVYSDWKTCEQMLIDGDIDLVGYVAKTEERMKLYDYCDISNGDSNMLLITNKDNERYAYNDYEAFDGMTIGITPSTYRHNRISIESKNHNFSINLNEFTTHDEMIKALDNEEIDSAIISNVTNCSGYKIISEWAPEPFYFIVSQSSPEILDELNYAMREIRTSDKFINERFFKKYFEDNGKGTIAAFTRDELDYIKRAKIIDVYYEANCSPLAYYENDKPKGYYYNYLMLLSEHTGLKFNFIRCETYAEAEKKVVSSNGGIFVGLSDNFDEKNNKYISLSQAFFTLPYGLIYEPLKINNVKKVAIPNGYNNIKKIAEKVGYSIKSYPTYFDCLEALKNKEVDGAIINNYYYEQLANSFHYDEYYYKIDYRFNLGIAIAVSKSEGVQLYTIFEKAIGDIPQKMNDELLNSTTYMKPYYTFFSFVKNHFSVFIFLLFLVSLSIIWIITMNLKNKNKEKQEAILIESNVKLSNANLELQIAYEQLMQAEKMASDASRVKTEFLAKMSHDMRTPMNAIIGMANFGIDETKDNNAREYFDEIKESSAYLLGLLNDVLDIQTAENGKIVLNNIVSKPGETAKRVAAIVRPRAKNKGIDLKFNLHCPSNYNYIKVDERRVEQIIINLINNAIKYTPAGGRVVWTNDYEIIDNQLIMIHKISDNGIGMSEKFKKHMFEPFTQENCSKSSSESGVGLGLAITKSLIDTMKGEIICHSEKGIGTTFTIKIPNTEVTDEEVERYEEKKSACVNIENLKDKTILLCEDIEINSKIVVKLLGSVGAKVDVASNGKVGVDMARLKKYDAILMDIRMPIMNGLEAAIEIRKFDINTPIIALSANAYTTDKQMSYDAGMNEHLAKPIDKNKLFNTISRLIS